MELERLREEKFYLQKSLNHSYSMLMGQYETPNNDYQGPDHVC